MRNKVIRKVISILLVIVMLYSLTGCGGSGDSITGTWYLAEIDTGNSIYNMGELAEILGAAEDAEISVRLDVKSGEFTFEGSSQSTGKNKKTCDIHTIISGKRTAKNLNEVQEAAYSLLCRSKAGKNQDKRL